ncbi:DoxX-like protein [Pseudonocardia autotrophica]|uniref:DoxX family protein n=2 Tax=Pseudonocardia TaxID=1847 RepID=A0ABQ0S2K6_9PSEU|nr:putative oxidoreductase CatD [Pseudonocardia autotrophica]TDN73661.1 DoxX-like protein [Pseudonocardia autotrophica]BBG04405.1 hypothetical protein Pdca_56140 [Pseudonocardia autotrophica]GEC27152.1 hypothetical protein PSA01_41810 [Pseudonocardia saturnea]
MRAVLRTGAHPRMPWLAAVLRIVVGMLFVVYGLPKFTEHDGWVSSFGGWSLPESSLLVYATGAAEVLGGIALIAAAGGAAGTRIAAGVLALVMAGAVLFGGILGGNSGALTLAPALLLGCLAIAWSTTGPGQRRRSSS